MRDYKISERVKRIHVISRRNNTDKWKYGSKNVSRSICHNLIVLADGSAIDISLSITIKIIVNEQALHLFRNRVKK